MRKKRLFIGIIAALSVMALLVSCGNGGGGTEGADADQYLNVPITADPTSFDSAMATDTIAIYMLFNVMEPLMRLEEQEDGSLVEAYAGAESYTVSDDGLVWTYTLRDNTWSDDQPVTADDYVYGISRVLDPEVSAPYSYIMMPILNAADVNKGELPIEELGVKALDEKTLEITLEYETSYFEMLVYHTTMLPVRRDIGELYGDQYGTEADKAVYNGPFAVESWTHNSEVVLKPNAQYWDSDSVRLHTLTYKIIQDENATYSSLENGSVDTATTLTREWTDYFLADDRMEHREVASANTYYQYYNQYDELFSNVKIRTAFTVAIDREDLNEVIYDGMRTPAYSIVPHGLYVNETEYVSAVDELPIQMLIDENPDPRALLIEGLTELGLDPDPENHTVSLSLGGTDQWTKTLGEYLQQSYKTTLGINVELNMQDWGAFSSDWYSYEYQFGQMSFGADFNDPLSMLSSLDSSMDGFLIGWGDETVDELLYASYAEFDTATKIDLIRQMDEIFEYRDVSISPLTWNTTQYFTYEYVKNIPYSQFATNGYKYTYITERP